MEKGQFKEIIKTTKQWIKLFALGVTESDVINIHVFAVKMQRKVAYI